MTRTRHCDDDDDDDDDECRMYVEREDKETLVLYIDDLRRSDDGEYSCESDFDGQLATQYAQLNVYGSLTHNITNTHSRSLQ